MASAAALEGMGWRRYGETKSQPTQTVASAESLVGPLFGRDERAARAFAKTISRESAVSDTDNDDDASDVEVSDVDVAEILKRKRNDEQRAKLMFQVAEWKRKYSKQQKQTEALEAELATHKTRHRECDVKINELTTSVQELERDIISRTQQLEELKTSNRKLRSDQTALRLRLATLSKSKESEAKRTSEQAQAVNLIMDRTVSLLIIANRIMVDGLRASQQDKSDIKIAEKSMLTGLEVVQRAPITAKALSVSDQKSLVDSIQSLRGVANIEAIHARTKNMQELAIMIRDLAVMVRDLRACVK